MNKLALGTVQFGLSYGIANQSGKVGCEEAGLILALARKSGLDMLDTAIAYGDSESCLGELGTEGFRVVTKLPGLPDGVINIGAWVEEQVQASLQRLKVDSIYGLLLHRTQDLQGANGRLMAQALERVRAKRIVEKIGVSIYSPAELDALWMDFQPDLVQAPFNVLDRRLQTSGWLQKLQAAGTEIHTRSAFLQGLLLMEQSARPTKFNRWAKLWECWHTWLRESGITPVQGALGFVLAHSEINRVVVGVDNTRQLKEIVNAATTPFVVPPDSLAVEDEALVNPSRWSSL